MALNLNRVKDPQGNDLSFDLESPCVSGVGEHYVDLRTDDPPLYYIVGSGEVAPGTQWKLYCWKFCPFSQQWSDHHRSTDALTGSEISIDGYYTTTVSGERIQYQVTSDKQTNHTGTKGRMAYHNRGRKFGFICVDPNCYYYQQEGQYFFQV